MENTINTTKIEAYYLLPPTTKHPYKNNVNDKIIKSNLFDIRLYRYFELPETNILSDLLSNY